MPMLVAYGGWWVSPAMAAVLTRGDQYFGVHLGAHIESAWRSYEYNKRLQERWDQGEREGLTVRPADSSLHSTGDAVDLSFASTKFTEAFRDWWVHVENNRWGGSFLPRDPNHYDLGQATISVYEHTI